MLDVAFSNEQERLYRAVHISLSFWNFETNRPHLSAFRDPKGLSVDRDGGRDEKTIITRFQQNFRLGAVVSLNIQECREIGTFPIYKKSKNNIYHSEIHDSENTVFISRIKARELSKKVKINFLNPIE